jgi:hypothetical protein
LSQDYAININNKSLETNELKDQIKNL